MNKCVAFLAEQIEVALIMRATFVLLPVIGWSFYTGNAAWLQASIVTMSAFMVEERVKLAPVGVVIHGLLIMACFALLFLTLSVPWLFVLLTAVLAAGTVWIAGHGRNLRTLGNFTFIPALYLACELAESTAGQPARETLLMILPYQFTVLLPAFMMAVWRHARDPVRRQPRWYLHHLRLHRSADFGPQMPYGEAMVAIAVGVGLASLLVVTRHIDHGQWVIWSAASVVTGEVSTARTKLRDRSLGAVIGVPLGLLGGALLPHNAFSYGLASLATMLTLVAFRRYIWGFGTRCACIATTLTIAGQAPSIAAERVVNVMLGGFISVICVMLLRRYVVHRQGGDMPEASQH